MATYASFPAHALADLRGVERLKEAKIGAFSDGAMRVCAPSVNIHSLALARRRYIRRRIQRSVPPPTLPRPPPKHHLSLFQLGRKQQADESLLRKSKLDSSRMVSTCQLFGKSSTFANSAIPMSSRYARWLPCRWSVPDRSPPSIASSSWMCTLQRRTLTSS